MTQQIYNKTAENEKNKGAAMGQPKSRPQSDWNALARPSDSCAEMNACKRQWNEAIL